MTFNIHFGTSKIISRIFLKYNIQKMDFGNYHIELSISNNSFFVHIQQKISATFDLLKTYISLMIILSVFLDI